MTVDFIERVNKYKDQEIENDSYSNLPLSDVVDVVVEGA